MANGISWIALEARKTHLHDASTPLATWFIGILDDAHCNSQAKKAKLIAFPNLAAIAKLPISLDHLFSSVYSRIVLTQAAQHELNPKSTMIIYIANVERVGQVFAIPIEPRHIIRAERVICKDFIPPSESMIGPRKILPAAIESVDNARRREITSSRDSFAL